jgi:hypothetical protein
MKHIKTFEWKSQIKPQIGNSVICDPDYPTGDSFKEFFNKKIGKIINITYDEIKDINIINILKTNKDIIYEIKYKSAPKNLDDDYEKDQWDYISNSVLVSLQDIKYFAPTKKELKQLLLNKKYNL